MTVSNEIFRISYAGNGSIVNFTFTGPSGFHIFSDTELIVSVMTEDVETVLALDSDYSVHGAGTSNGYITLSNGSLCPSGSTLYIERFVSAVQTTDYTEGERFPAAAHENALDKLTMLIIQLKASLDRAILLKKLTTTSGVTFPEPSSGKLLRWNVAADDLENVDIASIGAVALTDLGQSIIEQSTVGDILDLMGASAFGQERLADEDEDETLTALGVTEFIKTLLVAEDAIAAKSVLSVTSGLSYKGGIDCSANPNYPAADAGHMYKCTVEGKIGGASGTEVTVGADIICKTDSTPSGTEAEVGSDWDVVVPDLGGVVIGPVSATDGDFCQFDGVTGALIKGGLKAGTGANNIVQLDGDGKLPAVNGSLLTNLPEQELELTANSIEGQHFLNVTVGSDITLGKATTQRSTTSTSYVKLKEFAPLQRNGNVSISFNLFPALNGLTVRARVYVNGAFVGGTLSANSSFGTTVSADYDGLTAGDVVAIYGLTTNGAYSCRIKDAYITANDPYVAREATGY